MIEEADAKAPEVPTANWQHGLRRRLALSFGAQGALQAVRTAQQLLIVPLFIKAWGEALYADWLVLMAGAGLLIMLTFGTHVFFGNRLLEAWTENDSAAFDRFPGSLTAFIPLSSWPCWD